MATVTQPRGAGLSEVQACLRPRDKNIGLESVPNPARSELIVHMVGLRLRGERGLPKSHGRRRQHWGPVSIESLTNRPILQMGQPRHGQINGIEKAKGRAELVNSSLVHRDLLPSLPDIPRPVLWGGGSWLQPT